MDGVFLENLKLLFKGGVLIDIETNDGKSFCGWVDEVSITQYPGKILFSDKRPSDGDPFRGRLVDISNIKSFKLSSNSIAAL